MRSHAAKKSFHPPFKRAALPDTAASAHAATRQLHRNQLLAPHATPSFADDSCAATPSLVSAPFAPDTTAAVCKSLMAPKTGSEVGVVTPPRDVVADSLSRAVTGVVLAGCALSRRQLQQRINARRAELAGTKEWSLVADTLHWVTVSQAALQYLAETRAAGQVERVLSELHIDPPSVLFSVEESSFSHP
ncbi:hypothetical protein CUR178_01114 [Leishmania enriettii]|uniref:Uncharacterized protein n=1 Tax=Leishmania enriettii TaxID=5663 RepID=A0A836GYH9_LEIEN|nr:hypothetical protein CUR178_01114 [Leishmania enriettii]